MNETTYDQEGNIVEQIIDHKDGTATKTVYDLNGDVVSTKVIEREVFEDHSVVSIPKKALDDLEDAIKDPSVNSISEIKSVLGDFVEAVKQS